MSTRVEGIWMKSIQCIRTELKDQELNKNKNKKGTRTRELMWMWMWRWRIWHIWHICTFRMWIWRGSQAHLTENRGSEEQCKEPNHKHSTNTARTKHKQRTNTAQPAANKDSQTSKRDKGTQIRLKRERLKRVRRLSRLVSHALRPSASSRADRCGSRLPAHSPRFPRKWPHSLKLSSEHSIKLNNQILGCSIRKCQYLNKNEEKAQEIDTLRYDVFLYIGGLCFSALLVLWYSGLYCCRSTSLSLDMSNL